MYRVWLVLVLAVASPRAWAQPASPVDVTARAQSTASIAERRVSQAAVQRAALAQRYNDEAEEVLRLKQQKRSWRTDRQLQDRLAEANETAKQLAAVTRELETAQAQLVRARGALVVAIDAELAGAPAGPRAKELAAIKAQVAPPRRAVHRIVMPDTKIDARLDPEELDQQAAAIREAEAELQRQVAGLEVQGKELERIDDLRKQHQRAKELDLREDNTPRRTAQAPTSKGGPAADSVSGGPPESSPPSGGGTGGGTGTGTGGSFEMDAITQLADVVDVSVTNDLSRAQRSGDPGQRAIAAQKARDAVAERLQLLRKKRAEIEKLARDKRSH